MWAVIVLVAAASLWSPSHCQDISHLKQTLINRQTFHSAVKEDPSIMDEVSENLDTLNKLWTVHLPKFMEELASSNYSMSPGCVNSSVLVLAHALHLDNFTGMPELVTLLDATGKPGAGFLLGGNLNLMPAFDECFSQNYTSFCTGTVKLTPQAPFGWNVGLCVPRHCNSTDMVAVMNYAGLLGVNEDTMKCTDRKRPPYSPGAIIMIVVCALFAVMVLVASVLDKSLQYSHTSKVKDPVRINDYGRHESASERDRSDSNERTPLVAGTVAAVKPRRVPLALEFVFAFSLYKTIPALLATKQAPGVITSLNGLRVISMFWVILGHAYVFDFTGFDNLAALSTFMSRMSFQPVLNGFFSVDSFFFLSGVLVAYLTFRQLKRKGRFPFIHYYLHRYLRLTPAYAFVLFFYWALLMHLAASPAFSVGYANPCKSYWWTNFLYINNFYPWKLQDECLAWAWYLANDMQFYVISPLILLPLYYLLPVGLVIGSSLLVAGLAVSGLLVGLYDFQGSEFASLAYHYTPPPNVTANYQDWIYVKPWARFGPYLVGLFLGYVLYKGIKFPYRNRIASWAFYLVVWVASGVTLILPLYGLYFVWHGHVPSKAENIIYILFSRPSWGVGLALLVFACHNGYGGLINTFLSMKIWTPLSRMTFNAYLVHPIVIYVVFSQLQTSIHLTDITMSVFTIAFVVLSYAVAAVVCVCVEFPLGTIEMLLFRLIGLGGRVTQRQGGGTEQKQVTKTVIQAKE